VLSSQWHSSLLPYAAWTRQIWCVDRRCEPSTDSRWDIEVIAFVPPCEALSTHSYCVPEPPVDGREERHGVVWW